MREEAILKIPNMTALPSYCVDAVVKVPYGSHPWSCYGYYYHDIIFQRDYAKSNETRDGFLKWIDEWIMSCQDQNDYCRKVGKQRLSKLTSMERAINKIPVPR